MKVGFYQYDVAHKNKNANLNKIVTNLSDKNFDLVVLPELFTTGYLFDSREELLELAEYLPDGDSIQILENITNVKKCYIIGTIPEIEDDKIYNTAIVVGPNGYIGKQRKLHLTKLEQKYFEPGKKIRTFDLGRTRIGITTCFDSWYPEVSRLLCSNGAQILCQPSNFGDEKTLCITRTRAVENLVFSITSNRIGEEKNESVTAAFRGESQIINPNGEIIGKTDNLENITIVEIDTELAKKKDTDMCDFSEEWKKYEVKSESTFSIG